MAGNSLYGQFSQLGALPAYNAPVQQSAITGSQNYLTLAGAADQERQMSMQRAAGRQNAVIGGYDQQIANSRRLGDQGYATLAGNYDAIAADAASTRERNMGRIDQYGNSARQDLAIKNQQALAAAQHSAIKRGLGNTTITDSLMRGQNFDNTRQQLSLEDQLLQNRISTDANLSGAYQNVLQNRAQGLADQFNRNLSTENQLTSNRLGYIGGIQDDQTGFDRVANIYQQGWQMQQQALEAQLNRDANDPALQYQKMQLMNPQKRGYDFGAFGGRSMG